MISVVAPVYNEEKGIETFIDAVVTVLEKQSHTWELLLVNDGSIDSTLERIKQARIHHPEVRWVNLSRNYGHQAAVTAAIQHASGDAVIVMDADMQDPPHLIEAFIQSWEKGNQVIFARRTDRAEKGIRRSQTWNCFPGPTPELQEYSGADFLFLSDGEHSRHWTRRRRRG